MPHYEETIDDLPLLRQAGSGRHETLCRRLHEWVGSGVDGSEVVQLLKPRTPVDLGVGTRLCPDLALLMRANGRLWLAAEVVQPGDHQPDTVLKKTLYEDLRLPRLWMVDPRYDNVEVYHATSYGLMLKGILAGDEVLEEPMLAGFACSIRELFADA
jgi:hypothetical protein